MKILRLIYEWPPPWIGLTPAPYELTNAQKELGHELTVFCGRWARTGPLEMLDGVKIYTFLREPIRGTMLLTVAPLAFLFFLVWRPFHKVDVYHVHGHFGLYFYFYRRLFKFIDKTKTVSHFHICAKARWDKALSEKKHIRFITRFIEWPLSILNEQIAVKVSDAFVFVGEDIKKDFIRFYKVNPAKCYVIDSGVNEQRFSPASAEERQSLRASQGFSQSDIVVGYTGLFVERKNIHILVEALSYLPDNYKLLLVGRSQDKNYDSRLKAVINQKKLTNRVTFTGEKDYPDTPKFFKMMDVFALPSSYEGFPKVVLEALSTGVPTLASGFAVPDIKGLFEVRKIEAEYLAKMLSEVVGRKAVVDREAVVSKYSWKRRAEEIDKVYNSI